MSTNTNYTKGQRVRTTRDLRFMTPDFPGWGKQDESHFVTLPAGTEATVVSVSSHGSNPWTRWSIRTDAGHLHIDACPDQITAVV